MGDFCFRVLWFHVLIIIVAFKLVVSGKLETRCCVLTAWVHRSAIVSPYPTRGLYRVLYISRQQQSIG